MQYRLLLIDDDSLNLSATANFLESNGFNVDQAQSGATALELLGVHRDEYAVAILDYKLGEQTGEQVARELLQVRPDLFILMHSGDTSTETVRSSFKSGAVDFISKESSPDELLKAIKNYCKKFDETTRVISPHRCVTDDSENLISSVGLTGKSKSMLEVAKKVLKYRGLEDSVLILGETGVGKEIVARALHPGTDRSADLKFFPINCASFQGKGDLLESELFGHEKGAFTGAILRKVGILEAASGGTVFLDEIHCLSFEAQNKLLRALNNKRIRRVGGMQEYPVHFRLITAAKPNLAELAEEGTFSRDLYYRLRVLRIEIPPLRDRAIDIEPLIAFFCSQHNSKTGQNRRFLAKTLTYLESYSWPGNIRELESTVKEILINNDAERIEPHHLEAKFFAEHEPNRLRYEEFKKDLEKKEREYLLSVLSSTPTKTQAATKLGISPTTLQSRMERLGLLKSDPKSRQIH